MFCSLPVITTSLWKKCSVACQVPFCVLNGLQRETQIVWWGWLFCCPNPKSRVCACRIRLWFSDRWGYLWNEADLPPVEGEWEGLPLHLHRRLCDRLESEPLRRGEIWNTAMWVTVSWLALAGTESITWAPPMPWCRGVWWAIPTSLQTRWVPGKGWAQATLVLALSVSQQRSEPNEHLINTFYAFYSIRGC